MAPRMRLRLTNPISVESWAVVGVPVALAVGGITYAAVRWIMGGTVTPGDACPLETYEAILGSELPSEVIGRAWHWMPFVRYASAQFSIPWPLLAGLITTESRWKPEAGSKAGAVGLTQFIPSTAKSIQGKLIEQGRWPYGSLDRTNPEQAIWLGAAFLRRLLDTYGDTETALAVYNAGTRVVGKPSYEWPAETQAYVPGVLRRTGWFQELDAAC